MADVIYLEISDAVTEINSAANEYYAAIRQGFNAFTPLH